MPSTSLTPPREIKFTPFEPSYCDVWVLYLTIPAVLAEGLFVEFPTGSFTPPVPETERSLDEAPGAITISSFWVDESVTPSIDRLLSTRIPEPRVLIDCAVIAPVDLLIVIFVLVLTVPTISEYFIYLRKVNVTVPFTEVPLVCVGGNPASLLEVPATVTWYSLSSYLTKAFKLYGWDGPQIVPGNDWALDRDEDCGSDNLSPDKYPSPEFDTVVLVIVPNLDIVNMAFVDGAVDVIVDPPTTVTKLVYKNPKEFEIK